MAQFRNKPVVIDAFQLTQDFLDSVKCSPQDGIYFRADHALIPTLEGKMRTDVGDWIITGVKGEKYPCKPDIFAATYESVPNQPQHNQK